MPDEPLPPPDPPVPPYRVGIDDIGGIPGGDDTIQGAPTDGADPNAGEADFRAAVLAILTEIRDALLDEVT